MALKIPNFLGKRAKPTLPVSFDFATGIHNAPGWRIVPEPPCFTCIEPATGPFVDRTVLRAIREFYPNVVALWQLRLWLPPNSMRTVTVARMSLGGWDPDPERLRLPFRCDLPARWKGPQPNIVGRPLDVLNHDGPSDPIPFDWRVYHLARAEYIDDKGALDEAERRHDEREEAVKTLARHREQHEAEEDAYFRKHLQKIIDKHQPTESDWNDYYGLLTVQRERSLRLGVSRKPFIHVGRSAA